jgi:hypothetical protein
MNGKYGRLFEEMVIVHDSGNMQAVTWRDRRKVRKSGACALHKGAWASTAIAVTILNLGS